MLPAARQAVVEAMAEAIEREQPLVPEAIAEAALDRLSDEGALGANVDLEQALEELTGMAAELISERERGSSS
jgi:hypothetical protein